MEILTQSVSLDSVELMKLDTVNKAGFMEAVVALNYADKPSVYLVLLNDKFKALMTDWHQAQSYAKSLLTDMREFDIKDYDRVRIYSFLSGSFSSVVQYVREKPA